MIHTVSHLQCVSVNTLSRVSSAVTWMPLHFSIYLHLQSENCVECAGHAKIHTNIHANPRAQVIWCGLKYTHKHT